MLVEDDKSLREIYGVRLLAEGYDIVSAGDGEEALAMAIKERPGLIISDVMMPKISGFDMLDILRSTTETKGIKVIMMTALSSDEQRTRGEQLGADRYLVKSQVGIEDVVRVVHEVLADSPGIAPTPAAAPAPAPAAPAVPPRPMPAPTAATRPVAPAAPAPSSMPQPTQVTPPVPPTPAEPVASRPMATNQPAHVITPPQPVTHPAPAAPAHSSNTPQAPSNHSRVIQPLNDPGVARVDINDLLDKELAKEAGVNATPQPPAPAAATVEQEKQLMNDQLNQFKPPQPPTPTTIPDVNINSEGQLSSTQNPGPNTPTPPVPPAPAA
jgi:CheY-like chemotaxis protein